MEYGRIFNYRRAEWDVVETAETPRSLRARKVCAP